MAYPVQTEEIDSLTGHILQENYIKARGKRQAWESLWQDCYDYALPQRGVNQFSSYQVSRKGERLYDATALDAVDQLTALLLGNLAPPLTPWFGFRPGTDMTAEQFVNLTPILEKTASILATHFDHSNFIVELHQCFLDLVVSGTACLALEEAEPGMLSAFRFTAIPMGEVVLEEGKSGRLDHVYKPLTLTLEQIYRRYPDITLPVALIQKGTGRADHEFSVIESVIPEEDGTGFRFIVLDAESNDILHLRHIETSPYITFRWMKSPGEIYGRSPVMKALPDIKTVNKVVELILKNASIAVTGIWQAEDDGVLNPATIELVPGAIIPKAVGSKGLTPLEMPARFDISQIILEDLRGRIRHAFLVDRLPQLDTQRRTTTEIIERSSEMSILLGATFGRLQAELLSPLIQQAYGILRRRGAVLDLPLDGRVMAIDYRSPLARPIRPSYTDNIELGGSFKCDWTRYNEHGRPRGTC